ncbi:sigma-54-dependent transcriptional regulator [Rossellomorea vietnamensis]|uniref:Sigma-54-dependent transcriptional regulator n=2 Tax=Rossellomorea TaxID=2837508 RepID=A0A5D4KGB7_9BACI|nr:MULTISPECIES: sigma-54-dependent Fis family transcriptional regulator [Rossellomorea]TYR76327.1 sigma-54-dependent transcriptional regulator [Rossellomorea vietnamensis]TYS76266.1 sigma-54-dependent transcriptional regulator [Rossellomorea aquimaris]
MQKVLVVGGGKGGIAILRILGETSMLEVAAVCDLNEESPGIRYAKDNGIPFGNDWRNFLNEEIDIIIEVTGDQAVFESLREARGKNAVVIPGSVAYLVAKLLKEKEHLIDEMKFGNFKRDLILNSTGDGMVGIDTSGTIILFNRSAEKMIGTAAADALGKHISEVIPKSELPRVLETQRNEINKELVLENGLKIITNRIPMITEDDEVMGAFSVFKDITDVVNLAEEITDLREIQTMLQAIIQSSDDAISVVDEEGKGILINPAYTRITGLTEEEIIGKPATADISEGESIHLKVLQTRRAIRGSKMRVGPNKKEVIVNVAPIIVDGKLKGSVGVIHDVSEIQSLTNELDRARRIIRTLEAKYSFDDIVGVSEEMNLAVEQAKLGAKTPATVLLRGESGTGKELFAHAIHNASDRKYNKFIRVNCAAISENLLESELFGYEDGAFSGAKRGGKKGLFEEANNGSIFLDEIGELKADTQAKLLRVLQESEIVRVGGTKSISINVRVIAATNVNLEKAIAIGSFREDLYYRLNRMPIQIPPLRTRKIDIPTLCEVLIHKINQDYGRNVEGIKPSAMDKLMDYHWPGNVRELENILGRAIIFMKYNETIIEPKHLPFLEKAPERKDAVILPAGPEGSDLASMLVQYEKNIIKEVLEHNKGNKTAAAKALNISVRNLYYKLEKHKIEEDGMQNLAD